MAVKGSICYGEKNYVYVQTDSEENRFDLSDRAHEQMSNKIKVYKKSSYVINSERVSYELIRLLIVCFTKVITKKCQSRGYY